MMQSRIQTFRAATMEEALELVHRQLGEDFVIVESKEVPKRRFIPWTSSGQEVEIYAEPRSIQEVSRQSAPPRTIRSLAETMPKPVEQPSAKLFQPLPDFLADIPEAEELLAMVSAPPAREVNEPQPLNAASTNSTGHETPGASYQKDFESLKQLVEQLERQSRPRGMNDIPHDLFQYYHKLTIADIEDEIARDLIGRLGRQASPEMLNSPPAVNAVLTALIERELRCAPPVTPQPGQREIVTLVGPTGVGKTTTIAKLAAYYHLNEGLRVGLITIDTYRIGAVEQLRSFADILQLPLHAASNSDELRTAIAELDDVDLILIDTAGRGPFEPHKMNELKETIQISGSNHVLLVLSMAAGPKALSRIASQFAIANPTSLILTKLDEAPGGGGLLTVAREITCPVSYITTGQDVPDQIEPALPSRLARLVLGRDPINPASAPL